MCSPGPAGRAGRAPEPPSPLAAPFLFSLRSISLERSPGRGGAAPSRRRRRRWVTSRFGGGPVSVRPPEAPRGRARASELGATRRRVGVSGWVPPGRPPPAEGVGSPDPSRGSGPAPPGRLAACGLFPPLPWRRLPARVVRVRGPAWRRPCGA